MSFITIDNATRRYPKGVVALDRVSLEIKQGEWLAVMGPSGSGKTTLLNLLGGLDRADEGRVIVDGLDLARIPRPELIRYRRERVGLVFQQFHLIPYLNALENVMLAQYLHSMADQGEAIRALERIGLGDRPRHPGSGESRLHRGGPPPRRASDPQTPPRGDPVLRDVPDARVGRRGGGLLLRAHPLPRDDRLDLWFPEPPAGLSPRQADPARRVLRGPAERGAVRGGRPQTTCAPFSRRITTRRSFLLSAASARGV